MRISRVQFWGLLALVALFFSGCEAFIPVPKSQLPPPPPKPPMAYEPLSVRNSCMVESIHLYDVYLQKHRGAADAWARVLQWGIKDGDFNVAQGHAVTVFSLNGKLWTYDINFGFQPLDVPVDRRADLTEVTPRVFSHYPQFKTAYALYRDDYFQQPQKKTPDFLFYHANQDVRDATRVASELGRFRPVRVVEFSFPENGQLQASAATVFVFGARVCVYFPRQGTHISQPLVYNTDDLNYIRYVIQRLHPGARDVHWQPGGYLLFPPKSSS
jgi:hypothetical protein